MKNLRELKCVPCQGGVPSLKPEEQEKLLLQLDGWKTVDNHHLTKNYSFGDFKSALSWVNRVGELAEEEGHHPAIYIAFRTVKIDIWTHKIDGLTESDFVMAAKIDVL